MNQLKQHHFKGNDVNFEKEYNNNNYVWIICLIFSDAWFLFSEKKNKNKKQASACMKPLFHLAAGKSWRWPTLDSSEKCIFLFLF